MDEIVKELIKTSPIAGALLLTMGVFLWYLVKRDRAAEELAQKNAEISRQQLEDWRRMFRELTVRMYEVIDRNTEVLGAVRMALHPKVPTRKTDN